QLAAFLVAPFFFFQAEDGIRDFHVTGVQTCALPICMSAEPVFEETLVDLRQCLQILKGDALVDHVHGLTDKAEFDDRAVVLDERSEERRVGKECRCRWSPDRYGENDGGRCGV